MSIEKTYDHRGFAEYGDDVTDTYGASVRVKQSSSAERDCVWIFIDGGAVDNNDGNAHLDLEQAVAVRDRLSAWIDWAEGRL